MRKTAFYSSVVLFLFYVTSAYANASAVEITVPERAAMGSTITITVKVLHSGNNMLHYTNWVWIKVNDAEIGHWEFTWNKRPEDANFVRQATWVVKGPIKITAKANCNLHGSAGEQGASVRID